MAPRKCCMPYCRTEDCDNKQFFKLEAKDYEKIKETVGQLNFSMYCCQNHYDLANDTKNFIKYKYLPGRSLLLRKGVLPHKKLPANVCRVCLKLVYKEDDYVFVSEQKSAQKADVIKTCLPDLDLSLTFDPIVCQKCFKSLESYYQIKKGCLKTEVTVVKCVKEIAKKNPNMLVKCCSINLFENYDTLRDIKAEIEFKEGIQIVNISQKVTQSNAQVQESNDIKNETSTQKPSLPSLQTSQSIIENDSVDLGEVVDQKILEDQSAVKNLENENEIFEFEYLDEEQGQF